MLDSPWNLKTAIVAIEERQISNAEQICLPTAIVEAVPTCAVACIQEFVFNNYSFDQCGLTENLSNLCTQQTTSGLTIGEGSLQCLVSCSRDAKISAEAEVYNVCNGIMSAQPETAQVLTATIMPVNSNPAIPATLPPSIGTPASTAEVTSIVMATWSSALTSALSPTANPQESSSISSLLSPSTFATTSALSSGSTSAVPTTTLSTSSATSTPGAVASQETATKHQSLSMAQVVGIVVGSIVAVMTLLVIVFICCHRRRRSPSRSNSKRFSMHLDQTPPPHYENPQAAIASTRPTDRSSVYGFNPNQRYYAANPAEQQRRSFWRKSIKPEEIGVAVSRKVVEEASSPASISSQHSMLHLLPKVPPKIPGQHLWPAPLTFQTVKGSKIKSTRPISESTIFDEDIEAQPSGPRISAARDSFKLAARSLSKRQTTDPTPYTSDSAMLDPGSRNADKPSTRLPLTPIYDNGNIGFGTSVPQNPPSTRIECRPVAPAAGVDTLSGLRDSDRVMYPKRVDSLMKPAASFTIRSASRGRRSKYPPPSLPPNHRKDSETTAATSIEDDATPDEQEARLELVDPNDMMLPTIPDQVKLDEEPRSPISNLRYPAVPRSAAISRQAEIPASPRQYVSPSRKRPTRDVLVRNKTSFMVSETTSSDGYLSDHSIEWPVPPIGTLKSNMLRLRESAGGANRQPMRAGPSLDQVLKTNTDTLQSRISNSDQARPNQSAGGGDLFFTVEM